MGDNSNIDNFVGSNGNQFLSINITYLFYTFSKENTRKIMLNNVLENSALKKGNNIVDMISWQGVYI
jgi:hypothetical protein